MLFTLVDLLRERLDGTPIWSLLRILYQEEFRAFAAALLSFTLVLTFGRRVIEWLVRLKVGDAPEFYNRDLNELMGSRKGTPTMGGLLICGAILVSVVLLADVRLRAVHLALVVLVWMAVLGGFDDWLKLTAARRAPGSREGLFAWEKLLFQLGCGVLVGWFLFQSADGADSLVLNLPFQRTYPPPLGPGERLVEPFPLASGVIVLPMIAFVVLVTVMIAGFSNAVNITDGMDGLAPGLLVIASFAMMLLSWIAGEPRAATFLMVPYVPSGGEMMVLCGAMAGACLGFLWFNCSPAAVFMGDTGSLSLGALLAFVACVIRQEFLLLVLGGVFLLEIGSVIVQVGYFKATRGQRILRCAPIHHHFHLGGWKEQQVVVRFWLIGILLTMVALAFLKLR